MIEKPIQGILKDDIDALVADEVRDLGDRVLVFSRFAGRGRGSGVSIDAPLGVIFDFRGGKRIFPARSRTSCWTVATT